MVKSLDEARKYIINAIRTNEPYEVYEKLDGCFLYHTKVNCWDGSTVKIGDIVNKKLKNDIELIGMNDKGELVPCKVTKGFDNGTKDNWVELTLDCPVSKKSGAGGHKNKLKVTTNHHIYINNKFQAVENAKIGDIVTTYDETCDENLIKIIRAGLLGDGSLSNNKYTESHKLDHEEYVDYLYKITTNFGIKKDYRISGYGSKMVRFVSKDLKTLKNERKLWYPKGKKVVPKDLSWIDDFVVAKWYMDDGSLSHNENQNDRACFATNGFNEIDVKRLADKLAELYNVDVTVYNSKGWSIRINSGKNNEINNFWKRISQFIIPCMKYKLPKEYRNEKLNYPNFGSVYKNKRDVKILKIKSLQNNKKTFPAGRKGYDIETTTHNYFINGILVHNSLGILYQDPADNKWKIATRGSFNSDQAKKATEMFHKVNAFMTPEDHWKGLSHLHDYTLLFEIIYPENRVNPGARLVVDYGSNETLVILGAIHKVTGKDIPYEDLKLISHAIKFPLAKKFNYTIDEMIALQKTLPATEEGFVVKYASGFRVKIKGEEYCRMQRILNSITPLFIWEEMSQNDTFSLPEKYKVAIPEEILPEVNEYEKKLQEKYRKIKESLYNEYCEFRVNNGNSENFEKALGLYTKTDKCIHKQLLFVLHYGKHKELQKKISNLIRPGSNIL